MNTVNNKRKRSSQEKIERIFIELIQTEEIDEISVTDICKRANLNRTTFYSSYLDIYDLADKLRLKLEAEVQELYRDQIDRNYNDNNFLTLLKHISDNQIFYKTYFKLGFDKIEVIGGYKYDYEQARKYYDEKNIEYHIEFFKAGFNAVVRKWLFSGCPESPEEMFDIIKSEYKKEL